VVRGEDHVSNTPRQLLLYQAFGYEPPRFAHLSLVLGPDHTPLSKRHGATSVAEFRARGYLPEALVNYLALIGWSPGHDEEILPLDEMARRFSVADVGKSAGVFDPEKLAWINRHYMKQADPARLASLLEPHLAAAGFVRATGAAGARYLAAHVVPMVAGAVNRLDEAPGRVRFLFEFDAAGALAREDLRQEFASLHARQVVTALADELAAGGRLLDRDAFRALAGRVRERTGQKGRALFHPLRVALTGQADGPELDLAVPAIEHGAALAPEAGLHAILGCRERALAWLRALGADVGDAPW
jgi:glutamyl-tRNA synthetase/nondiscriminating glutamyl-tRNA synthetase